MFQHNFESLGGTLISLRSLALALTLWWGRAVVQIPFLAFCLMKAERGALCCSKAFSDNSLRPKNQG
jgi:hypothetical protein